MTGDVLMLVGGEWTGSADGSRDAAMSPATGEVIGSVPRGAREDARRAIAAANEAFDAWRATTAFERAQLLHRVADVVESRREALARILTLDQGKPYHTEALVEIDTVVEQFHLSAEDATRVEGAIPPSRDRHKRVLLVRRPLGAVGVITPWNWPLSMAAELVAPALACGNTVVWTPAPSTAVCSAALAAALADAGLPAGVVNFVTGPGPAVGDEIATNPGTVMIAFIGSTRTGRVVATRAAGKRQLLELGGNGPLVVMEGADLERAARAAVGGCFRSAGQSCSAAERLLVHESVRREFVALLADAVERDVRLGDPFAAETTMGPMNNDLVAEKMDAHVEDALARGAVAVTGGARAHGFPTRLYWPATILDDVPAEALAAREETFGPIAPVVAIRSLDEAIRLTNESSYGLAAAIFTPDLADGLRYADAVKTGVVNVNDSSTYFESQLPFGGGARSSSGIGRVGGRHVMEEMTELQTITLTR
jgi:succinate-semialdehyde dehydrogenase/glutarate-semialdehyde dehydrogenase